MKNSSQFQKPLSVLMIFVVIMQSSGCYSTKLISRAEIPPPSSGKYFYIIHGQKSKYQIMYVKFSADSLSGLIVKTYKGKKDVDGNKIHIYHSSDSLLSINDGKNLVISFNNIDKVETEKISAGKTILLTAGVAVIIILIVGLINFQIDPLPNGI